MRLDIGSSTNPKEGHLAVDEKPGGAFTYDITRAPAEQLPLPDGSVDEIFSTNCWEHIPYDYQRTALAEVLRLLRPGGRFQLIVPDFAVITEPVFRERRAGDWGEPETMRLFEVHMMIVFRRNNWEVAQYDAHCWGFTRRYLVALLREVGFRDVRVMEEWGPSEISVEAWK